MAKVSTCFLMLLLMSLLLLAASNAATTEQGEKDCADEMPDLAPCIPYVSGSAQKPAPECCANAEKVRAREPKCLCLLIKESTNTSLGLPVNTTVALHLPAACNSDAKVSDCPRILKLAPDSPEAKIFEDANGSSSAPGHDSSDSSSKSAPTNACIRVEVSAAVGALGVIVVHIALLSVV